MRRLSDELGLISFFTAGDKETRAWSLRRGRTALEQTTAVRPLTRAPEDVTSIR